MGYDVYIMRKPGWFGRKSEITADDWKTYVASDPSMRMTNKAEATTPNGDVLQYKNDGLAIWTNNSQPEDNRGEVWFDFRNGRIVVKNPDTEVLKKMWAVAQHLKAEVRGEEDEIYTSDGLAR